MRITGVVKRLDSGHGEIFGYIKGDIGATFLLLGRNLKGYRGENLYKIGLVEGAVVSFDIEQGNDKAMNISVENKQSTFLLAFLASRENLINIIFLLACICAILIFKKLTAYLLVAVLFLWVIAKCQEIYKEIKSILR